MEFILPVQIENQQTISIAKFQLKLIDQILNQTKIDQIYTH